MLCKSKISFFEGPSSKKSACVRVLSWFSHNWLLVTLCTVALQAPSRLLFPWDTLGKNTGVGCHALLQGIFLIQGSNPCLLQLLHCRWILYCWVTGEAHMNMGGTQFNHRDVEVIHSTLPTQWKETISLPVFPRPVNDIEFPLCPGVCLDVTCVGKPFLVHYPHVNWY